MKNKYGWRLDSLIQLTAVRFKEFYREPEAVFWVFIFPLLMAGGLGIAFRNQPPQVVNIAATSSSLATILKAEKTLSVLELETNAANDALRTGKVVLVVSRDGQGAVSYRYDNTNPEARTAQLLADRAVQRSTPQPAAVPTNETLVSEPGARYIDFVVPGLLGMNLMSSGIWGLGFAIVDARRKKLLKRLVASPMPRWQFLMSFLLSRLIMLVLEVLILLLFAIFVFQVPIRGSFWELALLCLLGSLSFSALGLLISARARTLEGASGLMNFVMLPMWILSGVFFSADRFPDSILPFIRALPLTAVIDALRANMLRGAPLYELTWQLAVVLFWLIVPFGLALKLFRWK